MTNKNIERIKEGGANIVILGVLVGICFLIYYINKKTTQVGNKDDLSEIR